MFLIGITSSIIAHANKEIECAAKAVFFEARGESELGKEAVFRIIQNRTTSGIFPKTFCGVVFQKHQFSWVGKKNKISKNDLANYMALVKKFLDDPPSNKLKCLDGKLYFHNLTIKTKKRASCRIGHHIFL